MKEERDAMKSVVKALIISSGTEDILVFPAHQSSSAIYSQFPAIPCAVPSATVLI